MSKISIITIELEGSKKFREFVTKKIYDYVFEGELDDLIAINDTVKVRPGEETAVRFRSTTKKAGER